MMMTQHDKTPTFVKRVLSHRPVDNRVSVSRSDQKTSAPDDDAPVVSLAHIAVRFGGKAEILHDIDMDIMRGGFRYIYGNTGTGKSSLLRVIGTDLSPARGDISLFGQVISSSARENLSAIRRRIGLMFQDFRLLEHLSVADNLALPLRFLKQSRTDIATEVQEFLAWMGMGTYINAMPSDLSPGLRQQAALARAIIHRPGLLLLDEPFAFLDDRVIRRIMRLLDELNDLGTTIIIATHQHRLIQRYPHPCLWVRDDGTVTSVSIKDLHHIIQMPPEMPPSLKAPPPPPQKPKPTEDAVPAQIPHTNAPKPLELGTPLPTPAVTPPPLKPAAAPIPPNPKAQQEDDQPANIPDWADYESLLSPLRHIERWRR